jgi:hypothetical protein
MSNPEWQYCDCDKATQEEIICGCGKNHLWNSQEKVIHWRENHWAWACAFAIVVEENDDMRRRLVKLSIDRIFQRRRNLLSDYSDSDE